jgi:hypothetical protein
MQQLGPTTPEIVTLVQEDQCSWSIELEGSVFVQLSWQASAQRLSMRCSVSKQGDEMALIDDCEIAEDSLEELRQRMVACQALATTGYRPVSG